jgi:hypothetical protein
MKIGAKGELWVRDFTFPWETGLRNEWFVFGANGVLISRVSLRTSFTPHEFGANYVLGVETDSMDVQSVALYRLRRGASDGR